MKIILLSLILYVMYMIIYTILFVYSTVCLIHNPHPKFNDTTKFRFRDLEIKKTQTMFNVISK